MPTSDGWFFGRRRGCTLGGHSPWTLTLPYSQWPSASWFDWFSRLRRNNLLPSRLRRGGKRWSLGSTSFGWVGRVLNRRGFWILVILLLRHLRIAQLFRLCWRGRLRLGRRCRRGHILSLGSGTGSLISSICMGGVRGGARRWGRGLGGMMRKTLLEWFWGLCIVESWAVVGPDIPPTASTGTPGEGKGDISIFVPTTTAGTGTMTHQMIPCSSNKQLESRFYTGMTQPSITHRRVPKFAQGNYKSCQNFYRKPKVRHQHFNQKVHYAGLSRPSPPTDAIQNVGSHNSQVHIVEKLAWRR